MYPVLIQLSNYLSYFTVNKCPFAKLFFLTSELAALSKACKNLLYSYVKYFVLRLRQKLVHHSYVKFLDVAKAT